MLDCIFKFNKAIYSDKLFNKGQIFMRRLDIFSQKNSESEARYDLYDGAISVANYGNSIMELKIPENSSLKFKIIKSTNILKDDLKLYYIYSLYYFKVTEDEFYHSVDERMREFGNRFVLIENKAIFLKKIIFKLNKLGYEVLIQPVEYYNSHINQDNLTKFNKRDEYSYQNEVRILAYNGDTTKSELIFNIGNMKNFAKNNDYTDEGLHFKVVSDRHNKFDH
jgi:hypothetical protein